MNAEVEETPRAGRVAIVGRPNVGKSTLLNAILGQKLAITTPRPGTTRSCLLGVHVQEDPPLQLAFIDTPGLERPRSVLGRVLVEEAQGSLESADAVLMVLDVSKKGGPGGDPISKVDRDIHEQAARIGKPILIALNKVDKIKDKSKLLPLLEALQKELEPAALIPISALKKKNLQPLVGELAKHMPEGVLYDTDILTDRPERYFVSELIREALFRHTRQEVPYALAVEIEQFEEEEALTRIAATIVVDKNSQKGIVIGKKGAMLKEVGSDARKEIEDFLQRKVFLKLFVKVEEDWTKSPRKVRELTHGDNE